jgi:hypothetical protein
MYLSKKLFDLPLSEIKKYGQENLTYGSLTEKGLHQLKKYIEKYMKDISYNIYGFDLGCGDGELVYNLEKILSDSKWEGVEISEYRISLKMKDVCIWQGDMLLENFRPYNILHADNLCLDNITLEKLEEKIVREFTGLYITYKYPENIHFIKKSIFLETALIETTWIVHPIHFFKLL